MIQKDQMNEINAERQPLSYLRACRHTGQKQQVWEGLSFLLAVRCVGVMPGFLVQVTPQGVQDTSTEDS